MRVDNDFPFVFTGPKHVVKICLYVWGRNIWR